MYQGIADFPNIDLKNIRAIGFERKDDREYLERTIDGLGPVKSLLDKAYQVSLTVELPTQLNAELNGYLKEFIDVINELEADQSNRSQEFYALKRNLLGKINDLALRWLEANPNNKFLFICNSVSIFRREKIEQEEISLSKLKDQFTTLLEESKLSVQTAAQQINEQKNRVEATLNEIQEKSANTVVSNYAQVFLNEAELNAGISKNWFRFAVALSLITLGLLICIIEYGLFNASEKIVTVDKVYYMYDYSKLISKIFLISILIYLISYSFKKYSVYKHLQTLNRHRHNSLNSYGLFAQSVIGNDAPTRNNLMLQVAKAIYEHVPTGFLSPKQEDLPAASVVEITKILGEKSH